LHEIADTFVDPALREITDREELIGVLLSEKDVVDNFDKPSDEFVMFFTLNNILDREDLEHFAIYLGLDYEKETSILAQELFQAFLFAPTLSFEELIEFDDENLQQVALEGAKDRQDYLDKIVDFLVEKYLISIETDGPPLTLEEFAAAQNLNYSSLARYYDKLIEKASTIAEDKIESIKQLHAKHEEDLRKLQKEYKRELREIQEAEQKRKELREKEERKLKRFKLQQEEKKRREKERRQLKKEKVLVFEYLVKNLNRKMTGAKKLPMKRFAEMKGISYHAFRAFLRKHKDDFDREAIKKEALKQRRERAEQLKVEREKRRKQKLKEERIALFREHGIQFFVQEYVTRGISQRRKVRLTLRAYAQQNNLPYQAFLTFIKENENLLNKEANRRIHDAHLAWLEEFHKEEVTPFTIYIEWAEKPLGMIPPEEEDLWLTIAEDVREYGLIKPLFAKYRDDMVIPYSLAEIFSRNNDLALHGEHLDSSFRFVDFSKAQQRQIIRNHIISVLKEFEIFELPSEISEKVETVEVDIPYLPERTLLSSTLNYLRRLGHETQISAEQLIEDLFKFKRLRVNPCQLHDLLSKAPEVTVSDDKVQIKSDIVFKCTGGLKTIKFATVLGGTQPARREWQNLSNKSKRAFIHLFNIMCIKGEIANRKQFAKLKDTFGLYAFKSIRHKLRIICYFYENDIYLLNIYQKKEDHYRPGEIEAADKIRQEHQLRLRRRNELKKRRNPLRRRRPLHAQPHPYAKRLHIYDYRSY